jgi:hypothetical protein
MSGFVCCHHTAENERTVIEQYIFEYDAHRRQRVPNHQGVRSEHTLLRDVAATWRGSEEHTHRCTS